MRQHLSLHQPTRLGAALLLGLLTTTPHAAPLSATQACALTKRTVHAAGYTARCSKELTCQASLSANRQYWITRLGSACPAPPDAGPDWVGSNLVGWYGVRRRDGQVVVWNVADDVPGQLLK